MSRGENPNELLATNINYADYGTMVVRICIPTEATCDPAERNMVLVDGGSDIVGVEVLLERGTFLVSNRIPSSPGNGRVWECPLGITATMDIYSCELFAYRPDGDWDPYQIHADAEKGVVYVGDHDNMKIHAFFFDGTYLGRVEETEGNLGAPTDFTIYEGAFPPLSTFELPDSDVFEAGTDITAPLTLKNHRNLPIGAEYPALPGIYSIEATGLIPGTNFSTTITGSIEYDHASPSSSAPTAYLNIPYVGDWTISLTGGNSNPQSFFGSPTFITVSPAPTDPESCTTTFPTVITAGSDFTVTVSTSDAFLNPTSHADDTFMFALDDGRPPSSVVRAGASASVVYSDIMTRAGSYKLNVTLDNKEVAGSPLNFEVLAAAPHAVSSTHNIDFATFENRKTAEVPLELRVAPFDRFNNTLPTAIGYAVSINDDPPIPLPPPSISYTHLIPAGFSGSLRLSFTLDGAPIANSPVTISVSPDWTLAYVGAVMGVLLLISLATFVQYRRISNFKLTKVSLEMAGQNRRFSEQKHNLEVEKEQLEEEVRLKKHSEEELKVMVAALESVSKERQDELKEVMIESKELKIDKMLGKGGFGVVNLATYRGTKVAMKQLLTVNEENVMRFRHECFLMKNLSHPNIVQLVGVCWSEELFACCLEFVENGSLEDWLRRTVGGEIYHKPKTPVIGKKKVKSEEGPPLAEVVFKGFDHNGKYNPAEHTDVDRAKKEEAENVLHDWWMQRMNPKMGWTEMFKEDKSRLDHGLSGYHAYDNESRCGRAMAHGDLKPDNMLLTRDWELKLTDFGEARAQNMGGTMTSVGTPIYIAPEVMRADHYDEKADTWSYGLCLVAMIRAERTLEQFFYQALRKHKKRRTTKGLGMGQMNKYYYSEGWRPILPLSFVKAYPKLHALIQECWRVRRKERPNFDQIVHRLQGDIGDEIKRKEEPQIELYSKEDDLIYRNRIGKEDEIEDSDGEGGEGDLETARTKISALRSQHEKAMRAVVEELASERKRAADLAAKLASKEKEVKVLPAKKKKGGDGGDAEAKKADAQLGAMMAGWGA
ncbi:hypothetical protein TeGR_g9793 [Tetraparma gracilis]|uniref:Protein kinase domain-containing protein n=1 Tax=Tetraparma gracilis TaxID=2962635 RepID=A0ABQ6MM89_9STRA|nr:hypothetical protein TeGR_g9793 [Tetraparma gracilis]